MPNAKDAASSPSFHKILVVGNGGSGKTFQMRTLSGRKFAYLFDPAALLSLQGVDIDYEQYLPDVLELDSSLKGFNKNSKSDRPTSTREPTVYMRWVEDLNKRHAEGFFANYDWLCIDSLTLLANAVMDRQMWLNGRYGDIEDLADAFVDVQFGGAFRRVGEVAQNRRDPFDQEGAVGIIGRPVDRPRGLRIGAVKVERDAPALLDHLQ